MRKFLSLVLALVMMMSLVTINAGAKEFSDDGDITYQEAVDVISTIKVVDGYADGDFKPGNNLTRGAAAKIICNLILGPTTAAELHADTAPYRDVPVTSDFAGYIAYCQKEGIISGYADGSFRPAGTLTGYAFMKMLLGALGYDAEIEGYTGPNWSINVAKRAIGIGLNDSLEKTFNGVEYVTREEAALYAFNTLQADLVEYSQKITANVNGAEVTVGNSNATSRTWGSQATRYDNIRQDTIVQFAEEYFNKLVLERDVDSFGRPDREWSFDGDEIGAYINTDLLKQEYTTEVTGKDLYDLLGSNAIDEYLFQITIDGVDIDGKTGTSVHKTVLKDNAHSYFDEGHMNRNNKTGVGQTGKGVLTQVFVETGEGNTGKVWVAVINTYLAQATNDYSEKKDEVNLKVFALEKAGAGNSEVFFKFHDNDKGFASAVDGENAEVRTILGEDFPEAVDMKKDDIFLVNVANGDVQIISDPEVLEEVTLTAFSKDNYVISDEQYDYNTTLEFDVETLEEYTLEGGGVTNLKDAVYNLYLDPYGYLIGVQLVEATKNYIFLTGIDQGNSNLNVRTSEAAGILTDGTFIEFKMNMLDSRTADDVNYISGTNKFVGHALWNTWCTYTVDKDGIYTLKEVGDFDGVFNPGDGVKANKAGQFHDLVSNGKTIDTKRVSLIGKGEYDDGSGTPGDKGKLTGQKYVYGNDDSVYMVAEVKEVSAKNKIAAGFPVPGEDNQAAYTAAETDVNGDVVIIGGVESFGTGIDNISIKTFDDPADINEKADDSTAKGFPGWIYTLFDNDGYVIAAVVVGEDTGTTKNLVYSNTDSVKQEKYSKEDDEWTWTKEVIFNGEAIELVEKGSGLSKLKDMKANVWYEVTYKADETVKDVKYAYFTESGKKVGDTKAVDAALDHSFITADAAGEFVNHIEFIEETMTGDSSTVLYEEVWGAVTTRNEANDDDVPNSYGDVATGHGDGSAKTVLAEDNAPSLKGSTLYTDTNARMGFYVHKDVKSVLIQKNDGKSTTSYGTGTTDLERFLAELNFDETAADSADHSYLFKISAVLVDGRATAVIIHDWVEGDASKDDDHKTPGDEEEDLGDAINVYVSYRTDAGDASSQVGDEVVIRLTRANDGRLVLNQAKAQENLPAGYKLGANSWPKTLTVAAGTSYAEAVVVVEMDTKNLKLPEDYEITYTSEVDGGKTDYAFQVADVTAGVEIPTGTVVTVKVPAAVADHYVKIGTSYVSGGQTATVTMSAAQDLSGIGTDKYHKITGVTVTPNTAVLGDDIELAAAITDGGITVGTDTFVKEGDITVTITATDTTGNDTGVTADAVHLQSRANTNNDSWATAQLFNASEGAADLANEDVTVTIKTGADAKDFAITFILGATAA